MHPHDKFPTAPEPKAPPPSGRRSFLIWATHCLGAAFAATLGATAALYFLDPRHRPARPGAFKIVAKLNDLKVNVPFSAAIREVRTDAWTLHPNDIVGRVWLIRRDANTVEAFNTTCPHLGCAINFEGPNFVCPCHNGTFDIHGKKSTPGAGRENPAPRDMDSLEVQLESDPEDPKDKLVLVKYESFLTGDQAKIVRT